MKDGVKSTFDLSCEERGVKGVLTQRRKGAKVKTVKTEIRLKGSSEMLNSRGSEVKKSRGSGGSWKDRGSEVKKSRGSRGSWKDRGSEGRGNGDGERRGEGMKGVKPYAQSSRLKAERYQGGN